MFILKRVSITDDKSIIAKTDKGNNPFPIRSSLTNNSLYISQICRKMKNHGRTIFTDN